MRVEAGACAVIVGGLKRHPEHPGLQTHGLCAMQRLAVNDRAQEEFHELGACAVVLDSLKRHDTHAGVQHRH